MRYFVCDHCEPPFERTEVEGVVREEDLNEKQSLTCDICGRVLENLGKDGIGAAVCYDGIVRCYHCRTIVVKEIGYRLAGAMFPVIWLRYYEWNEPDNYPAPKRPSTW